MESLDLGGKIQCSLEISEDAIEVIFNSVEEPGLSIDLSSDDFLVDIVDEKLMYLLSQFQKTLKLCFYGNPTLNITGGISFSRNAIIDNRESRYLDALHDVKIEILESIRLGLINGSMPWHRGIAEAKNPKTGKFYSGKNLTLLAKRCLDKGFKHNLWATYIQWKRIGANVRRGQTGTLIRVAIPIKPNNQTGQVELSGTLGQLSFEFDLIDELQQNMATQFKFRYYIVFNASQVSGYNPLQPDLFSPLNGFNSEDLYQRMIQNPKITNSGITNLDYGSLMKLIRWTGNADRCNRNFNQKDEPIFETLELLINELGAALLAHKFNLNISPTENSRTHISTWLKVLETDFEFYYLALNLARNAIYWLYLTSDIVYPPLKNQPLTTISPHRLKLWKEYLTC